MPTSAAAIRALVALSRSVAENAATGQMRLRPFGEFSIARAEERNIATAGITDEDVTSMFAVRALLDSYVRSATEHIRAAALLMESGGGTTPLLPIAALSRISCEATGVAFWLADTDLGWEDRLKRCNQLQFKLIKDALRGSTGYGNLFRTPWIEKALEDDQSYMTEVIDTAKLRRWDYKGKSPSRSNWAKAIPTYTQMMRHLVQSSDEPADLGQMLYSVDSGVVHSNPILVNRALNELTPVAARCSAALRIKTALRCHLLLADRITDWTDWEAEPDWFSEVERSCNVLLELHLQELLDVSASSEETQRYVQHLSAVFELLADRNDRGAQ